MCQPILESALNLFTQMPYVRSKIWHIGDPAIQAGDVIHHVDTAVGDLYIPVMSLSYKFSGTEVLESIGADAPTQQQQTTTDRRLKKAFDRAATDRAELESKIEQTADEILLEVSETYVDRTEYSALDITVSGIVSEVKSSQSDIADLQEQTTRVEQRADSLDVSITNTSKQIDGLTERFRFDENGLTITNSATSMGVGISEERVEFTGGENPSTVIYPNRMETSQLDLGSFSFIPRTNGNLSLRWTGG